MRNEVELSYHIVRGLYFLAVIFGAIIVSCEFRAVCIAIYQ